jgi:hypothetical protein
MYEAAAGAKAAAGAAPSGDGSPKEAAGEEVIDAEFERKG